MRVQPERPTAPLETIAMSRPGSAVAACSTHISPAPPEPITAMSMSMTSSSVTEPPGAQAADGARRIEALRARRGAAVDVVAAVDAVGRRYGVQALLRGGVAAVGDQHHRPVERRRPEEVAPVIGHAAARPARPAADAVQRRVDELALG